MDKKDIRQIIIVACKAIRKNLHLEIYMLDLQIEENDLFKTYKPMLRFPKSIHNFYINENIFTDLNAAECLFGVYKKVHNYKGKVSDKEFIVLCLAA